MLVSGSYFYAPNDETMIRNLQASRMKAKADLDVLSNQRAAPHEINGQRIEIYFSSLVLVTFGDKEAIEDVLAMYTYMPRPIQGVGHYITQLLPLPEIFRDIPANLEWLRKNQERLEWVPEQELFVLSDA